MLQCDTCNKSFKNLVLHKKSCKRVCDPVTPVIPQVIPQVIEECIDDSPLEMIIRGGSNNGKIIRKTDETPQRVSAYDVINIVTASEQAYVIFHRLKEEHPEVLSIFTNFQFEGQGQRPTPVVDARGLVTLLNLLPGHKAAAFRAKSADIIVRYLGGDPTLIAEINRNAEIQANLPEDHPMAIFATSFGQAQVFVTPTEKSIVSCLNLQEGPILFQDLGIPTLLLSPNCIYCIYIGYDQISKKYIFKYGMTTDIKTRIADHRLKFKQLRVIFIISMGEYDVRSAEDTIKNCGTVRSRTIEVSSDDALRRECFACDTPEETDCVMNEIIGDIKNKHGPKIKSLFYKDEMEIFDHISQYHLKNPVPSNELEIEKEKTKQMEEKTKQMELEIERLKLDIKLALIQKTF